MPENRSPGAYPGVYIEESIGSNRAIRGVGTSTAGFIGLEAKSAVDKVPVHVTSFQQFAEVTGELPSSSRLGRLTRQDSRQGHLARVVELFFQNGGSECYIMRVAPSDVERGIQAVLESGDVSLLSAPGVTDPVVQQALVAQCEESRHCFAVLDIPQHLTKADDILRHKELIDSGFAAFYHPWLRVADSGTGREVSVPPSGAILGMYARSDAMRGVHRIPAGIALDGCIGLDHMFDRDEQSALNYGGVNTLRVEPGLGMRSRSARTCSSDETWRYVNVRRFLTYLEQSIVQGTAWVVFEPNDERLWQRVRFSVRDFLTAAWRNGALCGTCENEAFYVAASRNTTMTDNDIRSGRMICEVGVAVIRPGEFMILRVCQKTAEPTI